MFFMPFEKVFVATQHVDVLRSDQRPPVLLCSETAPSRDTSISMARSGVGMKFQWLFHSLSTSYHYFSFIIVPLLRDTCLGLGRS